MPRADRNGRPARAASTRSRTTMPTIVLGVDFGTTYSGVAWAVSSKPDQINVISNWASHHSNNSDKEKSPTAMVYDNENLVSQWGFDVSPNNIPLKWFKFFLLNDADLPTHVHDSDQIRLARALLAKSKKHGQEAIADYLRELWNHSMEIIGRDLGQGIVEAAKLKLVFTIPAIWPHYAPTRMKLAIEQAGTADLRSAGETTLTFVSEPEAAALATMSDMSGRTSLKPGDHFIVCDAGGGTVVRNSQSRDAKLGHEAFKSDSVAQDIISYKVKKMNPLTTSESVKGDGQLCGSVFLDENFRKLLQKRIPSESWSKLGPKGVSRIMNNEWENGIKPQFTNDGRDWEFHVPLEGRDSMEIKLTSQDILEVFKPVVSQVEDLVQKQVKEIKSKYRKLPKFVFLVGGFGRSQFLRTHLTAAVHKNIEILQSIGARPWTAVCRGAVVRGLSGGSLTDELGFAVDSRVSRANFGTLCNVLPFQADIHDAEDKEWCPINRDFHAKDQTQWFLQMGEHIKQNKPVMHPFWQQLASPDNEIVTELIYSESIEPPERCDETVKPLCTIRWSKVPDFESLPIYTNAKGETFREIHYTIMMMADGVSLSFQIYHEGTVMASKNIAVDFDTSGTLYRSTASVDAAYSDESSSDDDYTEQRA